MTLSCLALACHGSEAAGDPTASPAATSEDSGDTSASTAVDPATGPITGDASTGGEVDATSGVDDDTGDAACPSLGERVTRAEIAAESGASPIQLAGHPDGGAVLAWSRTDGDVAARVVLLDDAMVPVGEPVVFPGIVSIRGLVAHDDTLAAVVVALADVQAMLVRFTADGTILGETPLVGGEGFEDEGDRMISPWYPFSGRLVWSGDAYAVYFALQHNLGAQGTHQGDYFAQLDAAGAMLPGGWEFHCSHSLDERLAWGPAGPLSVCLSDMFPFKAICDTKQPFSSIQDEPSGDGAGGSDGRLGGLVATADGFALSHASKENRPGEQYDVGLVRLDAEGTPVGRAWLTETPAEESLPHLGAWGDRLLAGWVADDGASQQVVLASVELDGAPVEGPIAIADAALGLGDFVSLDDGDVAWATAASTSTIVVHRVENCR